MTAKKKAANKAAKNSINMDIVSKILRKKTADYLNAEDAAEYKAARKRYDELHEARDRVMRDEYPDLDRASEEYNRISNSIYRNEINGALNTWAGLADVAREAFRAQYAGHDEELLEALRIISIQHIVSIREQVYAEIERTGWTGDPKMIDGVSTGEILYMWSLSGNDQFPPLEPRTDPVEYAVIEWFTAFPLRGQIRTHHSNIINALSPDALMREQELLDALIAQKWTLEPIPKAPKITHAEHMVIMPNNVTKTLCGMNAASRELDANGKVRINTGYRKRATVEVRFDADDSGLMVVDQAARLSVPSLDAYDWGVLGAIVSIVDHGISERMHFDQYRIITFPRLWRQFCGDRNAKPTKQQIEDLTESVFGHLNTRRAHITDPLYLAKMGSPFTMTDAWPRLVECQPCNVISDGAIVPAIRLLEVPALYEYSRGIKQIEYVNVGLLWDMPPFERDRLVMATWHYCISRAVDLDRMTCSTAQIETADLYDAVSARTPKEKEKARKAALAILKSFAAPDIRRDEGYTKKYEHRLISDVRTEKDGRTVKFVISRI